MTLRVGHMARERRPSRVPATVLKGVAKQSHPGVGGAFTWHRASGKAGGGERERILPEDSQEPTHLPTGSPRLECSSQISPRKGSLPPHGYLGRTLPSPPSQGRSYWLLASPFWGVPLLQQKLPF